MGSEDLSVPEYVGSEEDTGYPNEVGTASYCGVDGLRLTDEGRLEGSAEGGRLLLDGGRLTEGGLFRGGSVDVGRPTEGGLFADGGLPTDGGLPAEGGRPPDGGLPLDRGRFITSFGKWGADVDASAVCTPDWVCNSVPFVLFEFMSIGLLLEVTNSGPSPCFPGSCG